MKAPSTLLLFSSLAHLLDGASAYSNSYLTQLSGTQFSSNENHAAPVRDAATKSIPFGVNSNPNTYFGYKSRNSIGWRMEEGESPSRPQGINSEIDASGRFAHSPFNPGHVREHSHSSHDATDANNRHPGRDDYYYQQPPGGSPHYHSRQPYDGMVGRDPNWQGGGYNGMMSPYNGHYMATQNANYHQPSYNVDPNYYRNDINRASNYNQVFGYGQANRPLVRYRKNTSQANYNRPTIKNNAMETSRAKYLYNRSNGQYHNNPHYNTLSPQGRSQYEWFVRGETSATLRNKSMNDALYSY